MGNPLWIDQPDYRQPRSVTISWTVDSLLFYGVAYWRVTELYADDLRPSRFEWVANNRVTFTSNKFGTEVNEYYVDGVLAPMSGIGSLITFQGLTQGVLQTATREQAMSVPSVARARNIICATIASLPLETYNHFTKEHLDPPRVIMQPDPRVAGSAIYSWIAEDLLLYGVAYGMVMDAYAATDACITARI